MISDGLQSFLVAVQTGSLSGAAEILHLTPPAVTHRIKTLEETLGYPLLLRRQGIRKVSLTAKGEAFLPIAEQMLRLSKQAAALQKTECAEHYNIAAPESIYSLIMAPLCRRLLQKHPNMYLSLRMLYSVDIYTEMEDYRLDFAIINNPQHSKILSCRPAFQEKMEFISRSDSIYPEVVDPEQLVAADCIFIPWSSEFSFWYHYWFSGEDMFRYFVQGALGIRECFYSNRTWSIVPAAVSNWLMGSPGFKISSINNGPVPRMNYFLAPMKIETPLVLSTMEVLKDGLLEHPGIDVLY